MVSGRSLLVRRVTSSWGSGTVVILARLLTPSDFGIVTMVTTFSLLLRSFGLNGFTELIMQREEITDSLASNLFWINLGIGTILTLAFAGSGPLLAHLFHNSAVVQVTQGMSLTIVIGCCGYIHTGLLQRAMHFRTTAIINFAGQVLQFIVSDRLSDGGLALLGAGVGQRGADGSLAVGAWLACRWIPSLPRRDPGTGAGLKFAMNVYSHFAFWYLTRNTDNLLVGWRFGAQALGFYKKAYDLFVLPQMQLLAPMNAVAVSTLSRVKPGSRTIPTLFSAGDIGFGAHWNGNRSGFCFSGIGYHSISFGAWLGAGWPNLRLIWSWNRSHVGVLPRTGGFIFRSGAPKGGSAGDLIEFACTASLFLLALRWGPSGIALAWTASYFLLIFPAFWYAGKPIGLGFGPVFAVIWKFFAASVGAGFGTALIIRALPYFATAFGALGALVRMVSVSLVFFGLYLAGVIALHQGLRPLSATVSLIRELLPERAAKQTFPGAVDPVDTEEVLAKP